jgi:hypothetical protein
MVFRMTVSPMYSPPMQVANFLERKSMKTVFVLLASAALFASGGAAFAAEKESYMSDTRIEKDSGGNYSEKNTIVKMEKDGGLNSTIKSLNIKVDSEGNTDKSMTTETTRDPKGPGNKHVVTILDTEKTRAGLITTTHVKIVDGKYKEDTADHYKMGSQSQKGSKGNFAEKDITTKTNADGVLMSFGKDANVGVDPVSDPARSVTPKKTYAPSTLHWHTISASSNTEKNSQTTFVDGNPAESETKNAPQ